MDRLSYHLIDLLYLVYYQIKLILPFWLIGIVAGGTLTAYFSDKLIILLDKLRLSKPTHTSILFGSILGALSPITMHGMVPIVLVMYKSGMSSAVLASFIVTSVLINPNVFIYSFALGADIALIRLSVTVLAGYLAGVLIKYFIKKDAIFSIDYTGKSQQTIDNQFKHALIVIRKTVKKTFPYLLVGILLSAFFEKYVPKNVFDSIFTNNIGLGALFASALGVPLYFCGGGSVPMINSWMNNGMTIGSVMAFVITGPATKINNITAVTAMTKKKYTLLYLVYVLLFSVMIGTITDLLL